MTKKYEQYLDKISQYLEKYFEEQKPYIFCKEGCSLCCETGIYPFSKTEFEYAMLGYEALSTEKKEKIQKAVKKIKEAKKRSEEAKFLYECPFLIDKKCSIYNHRGLLCRSYGLIYFTENQTGVRSQNLPYCISKGLNYSNVYDEKTGTISGEKYKTSGIAPEPLSYNVGLDFLMKNEITEELGLKIGSPKALIDWFVED